MKECYFICRTCGNLIEKVEDGGTNPSCCNRPMTPLQPGVTDGATEYHVPIISVKTISENMRKVTVCVGVEPHPMTSTHYIKWIELHTDRSVYRRYLKPDCKPEVDFYICSKETITEVFAYCNLHELWKGV